MSRQQRSHGSAILPDEVVFPDRRSSFSTTSGELAGAHIPRGDAANTEEAFARGLEHMGVDGLEPRDVWTYVGVEDLQMRPQCKCERRSQLD